MKRQIVEYPYPLDLRWSYITWFPVMHRRLLNSEFGRMADFEVLGVALRLWSHSMDHLPPATLPDDEDILAHLLHISPEQWRELMAREYNPLWGWVRVQCGKEMRLSHPIMLEGLEAAVKFNKLRQRGTRKRQPFTPPDAGRAPDQKR
ncbi:hypothetical protein [Pseudophaeobacter flagellatus]|uniref:hypothetical protein n=1 Tax=Pseudophaeobacter flagellatus TaxID=2899119 RepID=UPI001E451883|nr:hypothetical protein [Pseudophaeobacter flagellatus]MCD9148504.1 hypothetical protein [Pseudophaeobacter flagellatus]